MGNNPRGFFYEMVIPPEFQVEAQSEDSSLRLPCQWHRRIWRRIGEVLDVLLHGRGLE